MAAGGWPTAADGQLRSAPTGSGAPSRTPPSMTVPWSTCRDGCGSRPGRTGRFLACTGGSRLASAKRTAQTTPLGARGVEARVLRMQPVPVPPAAQPMRLSCELEWGHRDYRAGRVRQAVPPDAAGQNPPQRTVPPGSDDQHVAELVGESTQCHAWGILDDLRAEGDICGRSANSQIDRFP